MDAELNTNVGFFGANLTGYPHIQEGGGNYNGTFHITDESPKTNYQRTPTDDLSHIWATNHRDNIVDLDIQLRQADINAFDPEYYGVKNLDFIAPATADMWDFGKFLNPQDKLDGFVSRYPYGPNTCPRRKSCLVHRYMNVDGLMGDLPRKHISEDGFVGSLRRAPIEGLESYTPNPDMLLDVPNPELSNSPAAEDTESTLKKDVCYPLWMILVAIVLAIFGGAYFLGSIVAPKESAVQTVNGSTPQYS